MNACYLTNDWAEIDAGLLEDTNRFIEFCLEKFDEGYGSVIVTESGKFVGIISKAEFQEGLRTKNFQIHTERFAAWSGKEEKDKETFVKLAEQFVTQADPNPRHVEIPLLDSQKRIKSLAISSCPWLGGTHQDLWRHQRPYWPLISDRVMQTFIPRGTRIALTSNQGILAGFRERFATLYSLLGIEDVWSGKSCDILLSGSNVLSGGGKSACDLCDGIAARISRISASQSYSLFLLQYWSVCV